MPATWMAGCRRGEHPSIGERWPKIVQDVVHFLRRSKPYFRESSANGLPQHSAGKCLFTINRHKHEVKRQTIVTVTHINMGEMKQMNYDIATGVGNSDEKGASYRLLKVMDSVI
uniref:Uncharacterized protein n=1 Tax=Rhodnius prolixus TaxID=13249 RepID=T1HIE2_RHOPR